MKSVSPIPVLMFSNATVRGGAEEHILQLVQRLDRAYFSPSVACTPELAAAIRNDVPGDVQLFEVTLDALTDIRGARELMGILRRNRIQVLHSHMFRASLFASPVGRICGVPVIVETSHGRERWRKGWKANYFIDRCVSRCVNRIIAVSHSTAQYLTEVKRISPSKITVVHPGCDFSPYGSVPSTNPVLKAELGFGPEDRILLVAGRVEPQKGHAVLLQAMPAIHAEFPDVRLVCLSTGSLREQLEQTTRDLGLGEYVRFVGHQADLRPWLALADICVLPSFYEGLPLAAIEAFAAGKPMVATQVDGTPEVVRDGENGFTVASGDPVQLAQAISTLLRSRELRVQMGQAGREFVLNNFSLSKLLRETEAVYFEALRQKTGRQYVRKTDSSSDPVLVRAAAQHGGGNHER